MPVKKTIKDLYFLSDTPQGIPCGSYQKDLVTRQSIFCYLLKTLYAVSSQHETQFEVAFDVHISAFSPPLIFRAEISEDDVKEFCKAYDLTYQKTDSSYIICIWAKS